MKKSYCLVMVLSVISVMATGQVSINSDGSQPDSSAGLDVKFTNKGFLPPRIALTASNSPVPIASPATGLLIYNTATAGIPPNNVVAGYYYWNGIKWTLLVQTAVDTSLFKRKHDSIGNKGYATQYDINGLVSKDDFNEKLPFSAINYVGDSIIFFGNSITHGSFLSDITKRWSTLLCKYLGAIEDNRALSSSLLIKIPSPPYGVQSMIDLLPTLPYKTRNKALLVISYGTNDASIVKSTLTLTAFKNAYDSVMNYCIYTKGWNKENILLIAPYYLNHTGFVAQSVWGDTIATVQRYLSFINTVKEIAQKYGTLYINPYLKVINNGGDSLILSDGVHPNINGHLYLSKIIFNYLFTTIPAIPNIIGLQDSLNKRLVKKDTLLLLLTQSSAAQQYEYNLGLPINNGDVLRSLTNGSRLWWTYPDPTNGNMAYSWGNHAGLYYAKADTGTVLLSQARASHDYQPKGTYLASVDTSSEGTGLVNKTRMSHLSSYPTLNQNTTGTAAGLSATLAVANGGTGATSLNAFKLQADIVPLFGTAVDSALINTVIKFPIGFSNGIVIDTLKYIATTTTPGGTVSVTPKLFYGPDISATGTAVVISPGPVTTRTVAASVSSFDNASIARGNIIWLTFPSVSTVPRNFFVQVIGHKQ